MIEVILLERIEKLGHLGETVRVRPGFARNYLLPQKKAMRATAANVERFAGMKAQIEAQNLQRKSEAEKISTKLEGTKLVIIRQAGDMGQLFGSVSARDIAAQLAPAGYTVSKNQVQIDTPIKSLGLYDIKVRLHPEVAVTVKANIARSEEEADAQEKAGHAITRESQAADEAAADQADAASSENETTTDKSADA